MKKILSFALLFFNSHCTTTQYEPDLSLLRPWGKDLEKEQPNQDSFVVLFKSDNKELLYIAGRHAESPEDKVWEIIKNQLKSFRPEAVVLEGFDPNVTENRMRELAKDCSSDLAKCSEKYMAIHMASQNTLLKTGEPSQKEIVNGLLKKGYKEQDVVYFYLVRQVPQMKRQGELKEETFHKTAVSYLNRAALRLDIQNFNSDFALFKEWYKEKNGEKFDLKKIDNETPSPLKGGTFVQHLSYNVGLIRDSNIVKVIAELMHENTRVMVLYGSSHFPVQRKVLEKMFGTPIYIVSN